jgi:hypothetical protein
MSEGKVIFDGGIKTQTCDAVKCLIEFTTGAKCGELPAIFKLSHGWQLTRSSKGDCYYVSSKEACSCAGFYYRRSCRHVKALRDAQEDKGVLLVEKPTPRQQLTQHIQEMEAEAEAEGVA